MESILIQLVVLSYTLYFIWLIDSEKQAAAHARELAAVTPIQPKQSVNDYFFEDNYKD